MLKDENAYLRFLIKAAIFIVACIMAYDNSLDIFIAVGVLKLLWEQVDWQVK